MYQILARKWRPRVFEEVIGQKHIVLALTNSLEQNRLHQAYLFSGTRGVGKTTLARIFARCLNCETGVTATPCGKCDACQKINEGRFADLIEVDAASRTGVDDMRELLENVQYKPAQGRYKVYLIDEVHMLSLSSFNALLKTLEEPPEHIMFLFATTHPKKIPVTVLSRCLQFNLTRLSHREIADYLIHLLKAEKVEYEVDAVNEVAVGADGSVRDGLSLLDQAIAHGGGSLRTEEVKNMLGIVGRDEVGDILQCVADGDAERLLLMIDELHAKAADFVGLTKDMMTLLHEVAIVQAVPKSETDPQFDAKTVTTLAQKMSPEDVQLFYQIALQGMRDIPILPVAKNAFEMTLLRMLSFKPLTAKRSSASPAPPSSSATSPSASPPPASPASPSSSATSPSASPPPASPASPSSSATSSSASPVSPSPSATSAPPASASPEPPAQTTPTSSPPVQRGDLKAYQDPERWPDLIEKLNIGGMEKELCDNSILRVDGDDKVTLMLDEKLSYLKDILVSMDGLSERFSQFAGCAIHVTVSPLSGESETPGQREARARTEAKEKANRAIKNNPVVQQLQDKFDARVVADSIRVPD